MNKDCIIKRDATNWAELAYLSRRKRLVLELCTLRGVFRTKSSLPMNQHYKENRNTDKHIPTERKSLVETVNTDEKKCRQINTKSYNRRKPSPKQKYSSVIVVKMKVEEITPK